jgi:hypothetical protein
VGWFFNAESNFKHPSGWFLCTCLWPCNKKWCCNKVDWPTNFLFVVVSRGECNVIYNIALNSYYQTTLIWHQDFTRVMKQCTFGNKSNNKTNKQNKLCCAFYYVIKIIIIRRLNVSYFPPANFFLIIIDNIDNIYFTISNIKPIT